MQLMEECEQTGRQLIQETPSPHNIPSRPLDPLLLCVTQAAA